MTNKHQGGTMRIPTSSHPRWVSCVFILASLFTFSSLFAQGSGTLKGRVVDGETGDALPGAVVTIQSTTLGAASDPKGYFTIPNIPAGAYTVKVSYLGYAVQTRQVTVAADATVEMNFRLKAQAIEGEEIVITAQARGQDVAINEQLSSQNVVNVVSAARIQELPDANAAESVGRLPGISLVRSGGQATQIVIRGLQPQFNTVTINGVEMPATDANDRGTDLSMISSNTLEGIEVYKTVTPDMDAAVLGGAVNFDIREAKTSFTGEPAVTLLAQGAYNDLMSNAKDYKFVASVENRFFDGKLGVFVQGVAQKQNLTSNQLAASYWMPDKVNYPDQVALGSLGLTFNLADQKRYDGTLMLDYKLPDGKIALMNFVSHGKTTNESHTETYDLKNYGNDILLGTGMSSNELNVISNILTYEQTISDVKVHVKLSNAYSDNLTPNGWGMTFQQTSAGTGNISNTLDPVLIAKAAENLIDLSSMYWHTQWTWRSFNKQDDKQAAMNLEKHLNLTDLVSATLRVGGSYRYTSRYYNYDYGSGDLYGGFAGDFRTSLVAALPWLAAAPYNLVGGSNFPIAGFYNGSMSFGKFLKGDYAMHSAVNADVINKIMDEIKILGAATTTPKTVADYLPDQYASTASDYDGHEIRSAGYVMGTFKIGSQIDIIGGVRFQGLRTSYTAAHFVGNAGNSNPYPSLLSYSLETQDEYHGYWLPDASVKYDLCDWLSLRASYTNTLAYPDFNTIIPREDVSNTSNKWIVWNNYALKPATSHNFDFQVAVHENSVGLFAVSPFLKRIHDQIFSQSTIITDPSVYPDLPQNTKTYTLTTFINNPNRVDVWGIETEWQTHFWYLPGVLSGLVLNVNYTHIFSEARYPYTVVRKSSVYPYPSTYIDTNYTDRLIQQPKDIVNLSIGFDYAQLSILVSMIYQSDVYNGTNFYNALRSDKDKYTRWDLSVKQGLPWEGLEVYGDLNNLNGAEDSYLIRGSGFPTSTSNYGLMADLGIRWKF